MRFASAFEFLLTRGWWPMAWPYDQVDDQQKTDLFRRQSHANHYGNLRGALN